MLDIPQDKSMMLGQKSVKSGLENLFGDNEFLMSSIETIRNSGNDYTHTQVVSSVSDDEVKEAIDSLFNLYAGFFILYFKDNKFGARDDIVNVFSILPPIIRYIVLNALYSMDPENLMVIDKLALVLLKAFDKEDALKWIEDRKETLESMLPYTQEAVNGMREQHGDWGAEKFIKNAPKNMYVLCLERIENVSRIIKSKGLLYNNFEQAKQLYLDKGTLESTEEEVSRFNSIMQFVYLGRKVAENEKLKEIDSYAHTEWKC